MSTDLRITDTLTIPATDLVWTAVRSAGPGGQNVQKVSTKVELRFDLEACTALAPEVRNRLRHLARNRLDAIGRIVITSQRTRSQDRNLDDARERLAELVRASLTAPRPRRPTRPTRGSQERRLDEKRRHSATKRGRGGGELEGGG